MLAPGGRPAAAHVETVNASLILYAEHDLAASTFAARVTASTESDTYAAVCTGVGTLRGPLHGGANEAVMHMLAPLRDAAEAEALVRRARAPSSRLRGACVSSAGRGRG